MAGGNLKRFPRAQLGTGELLATEEGMREAGLHSKRSLIGPRKGSPTSQKSLTGSGNNGTRKERGTYLRTSQ